MKIVDLIIEADHQDIIDKIHYLGTDLKWFQETQHQVYIGQKVDLMLQTQALDQIQEFHSRLFKLQRIEVGDKVLYLLSHNDAIKSIYEATLDQVSEGIQIYDRNGYFLYGNKASECLEGYSTSEFKGKHLLDLYELDENFSTTLTVLRTQKSVLNRCDRFKGKDHRELITINSSYPLIIDGALLGAATFEGDLTLINNIRNKSFNLETFIKDHQPVFDNLKYHFDDIIHQTQAMKALIQFSKKIALSNSNILITGETGTGKELFAQSIHAYSPRRDKPFVDLNCSAVPSNLVESLFFGTEKGAYTGSVVKKGFLELADGGTLFLDEINSMTLEMQVKLLRALQEKRFQRIGGHEYIECDVRILAASNEDLRELVSKNLFRKDFYYRISTLGINIPPLRERTEDIPLLIDYFLKKLGPEYGHRISPLAPSTLRVLLSYDWLGNVRELSHILEHAINHMPQGFTEITIADLPEYLTKSQHVQHRTHNMETIELPSFVFNQSHSQNMNGTLEEQMAFVEKNILIQTLSAHFGNVTRAAKTLGISRQSLQYRMNKYHL